MLLYSLFVGPESHESWTELFPSARKWRNSFFSPNCVTFPLKLQKTNPVSTSSAKVHLTQQMSHWQYCTGVFAKWSNKLQLSPDVLTVQKSNVRREDFYLNIANPYRKDRFAWLQAVCRSNVNSDWGGDITLLTKINIPSGAFYDLWTSSLFQQSSRGFVYSLACWGSLLFLWPFNFFHTVHVWSDDCLSLLPWHSCPGLSGGDAWQACASCYYLSLLIVPWKQSSHGFVSATLTPISKSHIHAVLIVLAEYNIKCL